MSIELDVEKGIQSVRLRNEKESRSIRLRNMELRKHGHMVKSVQQDNNANISKSEGYEEEDLQSISDTSSHSLELEKVSLEVEDSRLELVGQGKNPHAT